MHVSYSYIYLVCKIWHYKFQNIYYGAADIHVYLGYIRTKAGLRYRRGSTYVEESDQRGRSSYKAPDAREDCERRYTSTVAGREDWYLGLIHWLANPTEYNCFQAILRNEQFLKSTLWHNTSILTSVSNIPYSLPRLFLGPSIDTVS